MAIKRLSRVSRVVMAALLQIYRQGISMGITPPENSPWQGDIVEQLVYNHQLSSTELQQVTTYLVDKYGFYSPYATWPLAYSSAVQAEIGRASCRERV